MSKFRKNMKATMVVLSAALLGVSFGGGGKAWADDLVSSGEGGTAMYAGARVGVHIPTSEFSTRARLAAGFWADLPFAQMEEGGGPFTGLALSWWELAGDGDIASAQLPGGSEPYRVSGRVVYPSWELGYRFPKVAEHVVPWAVVGLGAGNYKMNVRTFDTVDTASGTAFGVDAQLGVDIPFDFGGAVQVIFGHTYVPGSTPEPAAVLDGANLGGLFVGLGYTHRLSGND